MDVDRPLGDRPPVICARQLTKRYRDTEAVRGITLTIGVGEVYGLLGSNGAGKSSTMRMIGCVTKPTSGQLTILGLDAARSGSQIRARLGVVPQHDALDTELSVRENLITYARYFGIRRQQARDRADHLLDFVQLGHRAGSRTGELSGGMQRRLSIARALVNEPDIVLLDEPTTGLDPQGRHLVWDRVHQLKSDGVTILMTTQQMEEAEQLCDRIAIVGSGRILVEDTPITLAERFVSPEVVELRFPQDQPDEVLDELSAMGDSIDVRSDKVLLFTDDGDRSIRSVAASRLEPTNVLARQSTLEDVVLRLIGHEVVD